MERNIVYKYCILFKVNVNIFGRLNRIANISYGHLCLRREELAFSNSREDNNMGAKFQQYRGLDELGFFYCCFWVIHT
jgi:hypothetical protein